MKRSIVPPVAYTPVVLAKQSHKLVGQCHLKKWFFLTKSKRNVSWRLTCLGKKKMMARIDPIFTPCGNFADFQLLFSPKSQLKSSFYHMMVKTENLAQAHFLYLSLFACRRSSMHLVLIKSSHLPFWDRPDRCKGCNNVLTLWKDNVLHDRRSPLLSPCEKKIRGTFET